LEGGSVSVFRQRSPLWTP